MDLSVLKKIALQGDNLIRDPIVGVEAEVFLKPKRILPL